MTVFKISVIKLNSKYIKENKGVKMFEYYGSSYVFILIGIVITVAAQIKLKTTFSKYSSIRNARGITGREAAEEILRRNGLNDVKVGHIGGNLTDHYDPRTKTVNLSDSTYNQASIAAVGVAAHECGHALQHKVVYAPLALRTVLVPVSRFGSMAAMPLILLGFLFSGSSSLLFIQLGIIAFLASVVFQIVTLPVEFNASKRAVDLIGSAGILNQNELPGTRSVLNAAALTYLAAVAASLLQLLRLIILASGRRN